MKRKHVIGLRSFVPDDRYEVVNMCVDVEGALEVWRNDVVGFAERHDEVDDAQLESHIVPLFVTGDGFVDVVQPGAEGIGHGYQVVRRGAEPDMDQLRRDAERRRDSVRLAPAPTARVS